ncbi:hypothetical protein SGRI78S_00034 [Streptomyces griseus subsp. griseus]
MLWARDLANHPRGYRAALKLVHASTLRVTGLQLMRNYEGMDASSHNHRLDIVKALLDMCVDVGAPLLLVRASATVGTQFNPDRVEADLRKLANLAVPAGVRIGFKAIPWSHTVPDTARAWELVDRVGHANLGLVLDAFHFIAGGQALESLNEIAPEKILLVQLADFGVPAFQELGQKAITCASSRATECCTTRSRPFCATWTGWDTTATTACWSSTKTTRPGADRGAIRRPLGGLGEHPGAAAQAAAESPANFLNRRHPDRTA